MTQITSVPEEGDASPWNHIRAQLVPCGDQSVLAPTLTIPGVSTLSRHLVQVSISLHQSEGQSLAMQPPSVIWKETLESHRGCTPPSSRNLCRLQGQGVGTCCPMERGSLISLGPPKCCRKHYIQYD
jgi:hypothetical protein